jgi:signal transduction histidine kinase/ligand-binding sensor domain-containing protein
MQRKRIAFLLCLFLSFVLNAQTLPFEKYTSKNGLISDRITAITQDEKGFMWFGSFFGICYYDGISFHKLDLPPQQSNKYVNCLLAANGKIYAGFLFGGGLAEYDGGKVRSWFVSGKDSASANEFICMNDQGDGSIILVNTLGQVYQFRNGQFSFLCKLPLKTGVFARHIQKDNHQALWIGTEEGLFLLPVPYKSPQVYFPNESIYSLIKDRNDQMWLCRSNGVRTIIERAMNNGSNQLSEVQTVQNSASISPFHFAGNIDAGFWQIDPKKGLFHLGASETNYYKVPLDLTTDINIIFADREQNIWIANEPGVMKISNFNIRSYLFNETAAAGGGLSFQNDSTLWVSNSKSLYTVTSKGIEKINFSKRKPDYFGLLYTDRKKNLWMGFWDGGLVRTKWEDGKISELKDLSLFKNNETKARSIAEDSWGNIWVAGTNGLFRIRDDRIIESFHPKNAAGLKAFITCITIDEGSKIIWVGDNALGLIKLKYEPRPDGSYSYQELGYISKAQGLKDTYIRSIFFDARRKLWIGTRSGGIYKMEEANGKEVVMDCNREAGLSCTRITDIVPEDSSAIWFATCDGIYRYRYAINSWDHFNTSDGLLNAEVFTVAVDPDKHSIWALTAQGLTRLETSDHRDPSAPLITITSVNVLGKPDSNALAQTGRVQYPSSQNSIGFSFAGASFIDEKKVSYRYMLEGYDKNWSSPTSSNAIYYASLPAGKYRFKVIASNAKGKWSEQAAMFEFEIVMPFYKRSWFIFLCVTVGLFIVYAVRIQRLKQRYKIEKLRLNIARDLHDDVGSTLGSINILSKTATRKLSRQVLQEEMKPIFEKIGQSAENTLDAMDDIVWSINPDKDKLEDLIIRMREFAIPLFEARNIQSDFVTEGNREQVLSMDFRRNVFLIYKEVIHNILKHAEAQHVRIKIHSGQYFEMNIKDDGKGFVAAPTQRNGLKNMQGRAKEIRGEIKINSSEKGTEVVFSAPVR